MVNTDEQLAALEEAVGDGTGGNGEVFFVGRNQAYEAYVTGQLRKFNLTHAASLASNSEPVPLEIYTLDAAGHVIAGLVGKTVWGWLEIGVLWVEEQRRGQGLGSALIRRVEDEARQRGCVAARLSTFDFQASGFYERLGYVSYGRLDGYPADHTVHYFRKDLLKRPDERA